MTDVGGVSEDLLAEVLLTSFPVVDQCSRCVFIFFNDVVKLFTQWGVLKEALNVLVRRVGRFGREAVILGHIFVSGIWHHLKCGLTH